MLFGFYLKKCFDTINHDLLLLKLQEYGVENSELLWFTDCLSDISQAVTVDGYLSSFTNINRLILEFFNDQS